jgi:hypothetical protein
MSLVLWNDLEKITENILDKYLFDMFRDTTYNYHPEWTYTKEKIAEVIKKHWIYLKDEGYIHYDEKHEYFVIALTFVKLLEIYIGKLFTFRL